MASSFTTTALQVNFDSVLGIADNAEMVNMFKALESTGIRGFLGCPSVLYDQELEQFFDTALVQDNDITGVVSGKTLLLLMIGEPVSTSCKKRLLKYEFRLLNDILEKSITVEAGSFDVVTHERFLMMTAIHFRIKVNWLFGVLKEMVDKTLKRAKGFAAQICVLLKGDPAVTLGDATTFPPLKNLSAKTVQTYVATNETIDARGKSYELRVVKVASVKKKSVHENKSAPTDDEPAMVVSEEAVSKKRPAIEADVPVVKKKKRTLKGKAAPSKDNLELVTVAEEPMPLQNIEQISAVPAERAAVEENVSEREIEISVDTVDQIILADSCGYRTV
ncbi:ABC transporter-like domain containing protein [Dorcoceras hygrometricum]|uniref:ABC transporter-like domain containing protein n=1 Tax=Dorcoceras hygrometricum TaxID=472368 RepID=A0A2Z7BJT6_9LAMI|nr:ABC transporter-like domain containing protein [Dorcoceras hygrometricum]